MQSKVFLVPLLFLACDTEPTGPDGPSGGINKFSVIIADEKEPFDEVDLELRTAAGVVTFDLSGSVDPLKDAIDDEYALHLSLELDKTALIAMSAPGDLKVKGRASFQPSEEAGSRELVAYQNDASSSPLVKGIFFRKSCFCANQDSGEQTFDGTMRVEQVSASEITGTLTIRLNGDAPNYNQKLDATLTASFNLAIP
jgi:hypothetical protein